MLIIDSIEFKPKQPSDPDEKCVALFNFETQGVLFKGWKIRLKDGIHYSICPPFVKYFGEKNDVVHFQNKDDFMCIARTAIQAAKESGVIKAYPGRRL